MNITPDLIDQVWVKAQVVGNNNPDDFRKDQCGAWIKKSMHGNTDSNWGWEIDHIIPVISGGIDSLSNLRPLHWINNRERQDGRLSCPIVSSGITNIRK